MCVRGFQGLKIPKPACAFWPVTIRIVAEWEDSQFYWGLPQASPHFTVATVATVHAWLNACNKVAVGTRVWPVALTSCDTFHKLSTDGGRSAPDPFVLPLPC